MKWLVTFQESECECSAQAGPGELSFGHWRCGSGRGRGLGGQDPRLQPRLRHQRLVPTLPPRPGRCVQTGLGLRGYLYFIGSQEHQHLPPFILKQLFVLSKDIYVIVVTQYSDFICDVTVHTCTHCSYTTQTKKTDVINFFR